MRKPSPNRTDDVDYRYLTPGAFKVISAGELPPDPPSAPQPYRLTPNSKKKKNLSFAIIAEPSGSRSPSPTGRVSPFRGRGFNPQGSRHASPAPSPPPEDARIVSNNKSRIPQPQSKRGFASVFGEKVNDFQSSPNKRKLTHQFSQSLTDISPRDSKRPPLNPRRTPSYKNFQALSPIVGSSPEPSQSQSSPSRIPKKYRSQPGSRFTSPTRKPPAGGSRTASRSVSRTQSCSSSRDSSPSKTDSKIPVRNHNYKNVKAKVNSFNYKPKVPPKPTTSDNNNKLESPIDIKQQRNSVNRTNSKSNLVTRSGSRSNLNGSKINLNNSQNHVNDLGTINQSINNVEGKGSPTKMCGTPTLNNHTSTSKTFSRADSKSSLISKSSNGKKSLIPEKQKNKVEEPDTTNKMEEFKDAVQVKGNEIKDVKQKNEDIEMKPTETVLPLSAEVVSSTTATAAQPLKIETKIEPKSTTGISPMVDGRILSATSVSNAMNKMNDTVIDSKNLMKEHVKTSPAAAIIAMNNENKLKDSKPITRNSSIDSKTSMDNKALDTKNATTVLPTLSSNSNQDNNKINHNHLTSTGIVSARVLEQHVQNNMSKLISPEHGDAMLKSANDRIKEARTLVASDVKPIKIMVKEKPMDVEVQSGNIRNHTANGLNNERPSLPPSQPSNDQPPPQNEEDSNKKNICSRLFPCCKVPTCCSCCKKFQKIPTPSIEENLPKATSCFNCCRKKSDVRINIESNEEEKPKLLDRLKCWNRSKVGDSAGGDGTGCFPSTKRRNSWTAGKKTSFDDTAGKPAGRCSKDCCRSVLKKIFCLGLCCYCCKKNKKSLAREGSISRRPSTMSKKKSLTPSSLAAATAPEDNTPKLDMSLVEHQSHMKGAIPVLPIHLAWFCCVMNCILPGTGTVFSGLFCLCLGIPRFSQKDGIRPRIGAFIIDLIIGFSQLFTVLFCLVGWGWSIWWGVIMVKIAKKHQKIKAIEAQEARDEEARAQSEEANRHRDPERGS